MYAWIWRRLPFGLAGKLTGSVVLATAFAALLWFVVFPWAEPLLPFDDVQVSQDSDAPGGLDGPAGPGGGDSSVDGGDPGLDGHDLPYDTGQNNSGPSPTADR
ncbi:hypothetical protein [Micromonospora sp. NPDC049679]|uniref:hypothetical protein n=1 Tax=Micromonospora sp. NPDC049679 TaxID=3155920 RepID=UPI0033CBF1BC